MAAPLTTPSTPTFDSRMAEHGHTPLRRERVGTLQINVGKRCNQACLHCHVDAGPKRTEMMGHEVADRLIELLDASPGLHTLDITGGAPELNPHFRRLVLEARARHLEVIDRCNLTVLSEPGQEDLAEFLATNEVTVVASLPCYGADNVDAQRGKGVFGRSIDGLQVLNRLGYGSELPLHLVYNPVGAFLPPPQAALEADYRQRLMDDFGIRFTGLFTITNMPISRFLHSLVRDGELGHYMTVLVNAFNPATIDGLMCRHQISVSWTGTLHDCDFNQMLDMELPEDESHTAQSIFDIESFADLAGRPIATRAHCYGCTAGAGSSCGGALE